MFIVYGSQAKLVSFLVIVRIMLARQANSLHRVNGGSVLNFREILVYVNKNFIVLLMCNFFIAALTFSIAVILLACYMPQLVDAIFMKDLAKLVGFVFSFYSVLCWFGFIFRRKK